MEGGEEGEKKGKGGGGEGEGGEGRRRERGEGKGEDAQTNDDCIAEEAHDEVRDQRAAWAG